MENETTITNQVLNGLDWLKGPAYATYTIAACESLPIAYKKLGISTTAVQKLYLSANRGIPILAF